MTPRPTAWMLESSDDRMVKVQRDDYDELLVRWVCGQSFCFTPSQLEQAVAHVEDLAPLDVWLRMRDVDNDDFVVKVVNGRLHARGGAFASDTGDVEWSELRELVAPPPAMGTPYTEPPSSGTTTSEVEWSTAPAPAKRSRLRRLLRR